MFDLVIQNGRIVTATHSYTADIGIVGERIAAIGHKLKGERTLDATGLLVTPGAVDIHVHMELALPNVTSSDTFYSGSRAAAFGGTTTIIDFVEALPDEPLLDGLARRRAQADPQVLIDYGLHMTVTPADLNKLAQFQAAYDVGCATFKLYMAYGYALDDSQLLRAFQALKAVGALPVIHAENWQAITTLTAQALSAGNTAPEWHPRCRPAVLEGEAVGRVIDLATYVGLPVHIFHVGCADAIERIAAARAKGLPVTGETCPQYLMLTESLYHRAGVEGALPVCAPPLRTAEHRNRVWDALMRDELQIITTDHAPFTREQKARGFAQDFTQIPGGVPSIEVRFPMMYSYGVRTQRIDENRWVALCCTRPAQLAGLTHKGHIAPGFDADLVLFNPNHEWTVSGETLHENCDWTPYDGIEMHGGVQTVLRRGEIIVQDGKLLAEAGSGRFIERVIAENEQLF